MNRLLYISKRMTAKRPKVILDHKIVRWRNEGRAVRQSGTDYVDRRQIQPLLDTKLYTEKYATNSNKERQLLNVEPI
jgi:hypothetical protein